MGAKCPVCGESPCDGCRECDRCLGTTCKDQLSPWNDEYDGVCLGCWTVLSERHGCEGCPECLEDPEPTCYCNAPGGYCKC